MATEKLNNVAVYRLVALSAEPVAEFDSALYQHLIAEAERGDFLDYLYGMRIRECIAKKQKRCPTYFLGQASAFVAEAGDKLWTVRHAFDPILETWRTRPAIDHKTMASDHRHFLSRELPFLLFDADRNLIFDSRKREDQARTILIGNPPFMLNAVIAEFSSTRARSDDLATTYAAREKQLAMAGKLTDIAIISLNRPLTNQPLRFATQPPRPEMKVQLVGFPSRTAKSVVAERRYFDGHSQRSEAGRISRAEAQENHNEDKEAADHTLALFERYFVNHSAVVADGFSGGPLLNEAGEVVSIQSSGSSTGGFGLRLEWIRILEDQFGENQFERAKPDSQKNEKPLAGT